MNAILRVLIVWLTLLALPLQGFASATMSLCALPAAVAHDVRAPAHGHVQPAAAEVRAERHPGAHGPAAHHKSDKCASCAACCPCLPLAPSFLAVPPAAPAASITAPFDQRLLPSVHLALPERPPRA